MSNYITIEPVGRCEELDYTNSVDDLCHEKVLHNDDMHSDIGGSDSEDVVLVQSNGGGVYGSMGGGSVHNDVHFSQLQHHQLQHQLQIQLQQQQQLERRKPGRPKMDRISLTPKARKPATATVSYSDQIVEGGNSFFPLVSPVEVTVKKRGRPRIHPPKDTSVKRPRGRPRIIEGEKGWRAECYKLKRTIKLKDALIDKLQRRLLSLGHSLDEVSPLNISDVSEDADYDLQRSGSIDHSGMSGGGHHHHHPGGGSGLHNLFGHHDDGAGGDEEEEEEDVEQYEVVEEQQVVDSLVVPSSSNSQAMDDLGHQTYLHLFSSAAASVATAGHHGNSVTGRHDDDDDDDDDDLRIEDNDEASLRYDHDDDDDDDDDNV